MHKPTFFLSSTVYDFKDLRSALKYVLEQQGCVVLASEHNDFPKSLDKHAHDACLATLSKADYYVLLIGTRVGSWYDEAQRISVTRQEYREAYKLHQQGKLKIVSFVRGDVWRMREDRRELAGFLETLQIDARMKDQIRNFPSRLADDAEFLADFISEVSRDHDAQAATLDAAAKPTGNWVHTFDSFRDITDVVNAQVFHGLPIEQAILRRLLLREVSENLRICLIKFPNKKPVAPLPFIQRFYENHELGLHTRDLPQMQLDTKTWGYLSTISVQLFSVTLITQMLERALESSAFLSFDASTSTYKEQPIYEALYRLHDEIRRFNEYNTAENKVIVYENTPRARGSADAPIFVEPPKLFAFLHLLDRWSNIVELSKAICRGLKGHPFEMPALRPLSPVIGMQEVIQSECVSDEELAAIIESTS